MNRSVPLAPVTRWRNALDKALSRRPDEQATYLFTAPSDGCHVTCLEVNSFTEAELRYKVQVRQFSDGFIEAQCTCPASWKPYPCWHAALALNRCGHLLPGDIKAADDEAAYWALEAERHAWAAYTTAQAEADAADLDFYVEAAF